MKMIVSLAVFCLAAHVTAQPVLFKQFGDHVNTPDGMAVDSKGNLYLSAPNYVDSTYPALILKMEKKSGKWITLTGARLHPDTRRAGPMGIDVAPDGNLYYCDNQYFFDKNYKSRIMRVVLNEQGEVLRIETAVDHVKLANAVRSDADALYFTDTCFDVAGKNYGGIYRIPFADLAKGTISLKSKDAWESDPYCLGVTETTPLPHRQDPGGADGLAIDAQGNLYTGNFGDGRLYTLRRLGPGKYARPETLFHDIARMPCADGISFDAKRNRLIIADSEQNAIHAWNIAAKTLTTLWMNDDTDGSDGLLDQPCEPMAVGDKLYVVNMDMLFPGLKNKANDSFHTLSVMSLK